MARWLPQLLLTVLAQQATALAAAPTAEHLTGHDVARRTVSRSGWSGTSAAEINDVGDVAVHLRQVPLPGGGFVARVEDKELDVFGNLMLLTPQPLLFANNVMVQKAVREALEHVVRWSGQEAWPLSVTNVSAATSLSQDFPSAVQIVFQVTFGTLRDRQVFIRNVSADSGEAVVQTISKWVPLPYKYKCRLPGIVASFAQESSSLKHEVASTTAMHAVKSFGHVSFTNVSDPLSMARSALWQEAVASAIAERLSVSRLQVGLIMTVQSAHTLRVDFWVTGTKGLRMEAAIGSLQRQSGQLYKRAESFELHWRTNLGASQAVIHGHLELRVPSPPRFVGSKAVMEAVDTAVAQVAELPNPQEARLSVNSTKASIALKDEGVVQLSFKVIFQSLKDRQLFAWEVASNGAEYLASKISEKVPRPFAGNCALLGPRQEEAVNKEADLGRLYRTIDFPVIGPKFLLDGFDLPSAFAMAIAEYFSLPHGQVGVLMGPGFTALWVYIWAASADAMVRQAGLAKAVKGWRNDVLRRVLVKLDTLHSPPKVSGRKEVARGSIALAVPAREDFANSTAALQTLRATIAQVASLPIGQVLDVAVDTDLWQASPEAIRVDFAVAFNTPSAREAFMQSLASDGGQRLAEELSEQLPAPFKGNCRLPSQAVAPADSATAATATTSMRPMQAYGTILLNVFWPGHFVRSMEGRKAVLGAIAAVAKVDPQQVGMVMTVRSPFLVSVDYWLASTNAARRQVTLQRVNAGWTNRDVPQLIWPSYRSPGFTACGGTVACCREAGAPYKC